MRNLTLGLITILATLTVHATEVTVHYSSRDFASSDYSSFKKLGLTEKDLIAMAEGANPSVQGLYNVARYLNISLGEAHGLIQKLKTDLR